MAYNYEKLSGESILIVSIQEDYSVRLHGPAIIADGTKLLDAQEQTVFFIIDASAMTVDLDDVILSASLGTRQTQFLRHPKIREAILVTRSKLVALAAKGLDSLTFGNAKIKVFETRDEALAYAR